MQLPPALGRTWSVARKELLHILRDRQTLFMTMFFPFVELLMLGYAVDTKVTRIPTIVYDQANTQESHALLRRFENSDDFKIIAVVHSDKEMTDYLVQGKARVGVKIPEDYSRRLQAGDTAQVQILVDGTVSSVAGEAIGASQGIALSESLSRALGSRPLPVEARPRVLFNPDLTSANFFIPGLMVVLCQMMAVTLSANAIVREKENGTLEQLFMTPVRPAELVLGKLTPYLVLTFGELCGIALVMRYVFGVPIHGEFVTLLVLSLPFVLTMLAWGLWVSTRAETKEAAMQAAMATLMPCIFLSGYVFPLDSMPTFFWWVAQLLPTTWLVDASRGVILRGAGWRDLWLHAVVLTGMGVFWLVLGSLMIRKRVG